MSDLTTRTTIRCPVSEAAGRLACYFARNGAPNGDRFRLTFEVELPGLQTPRLEGADDVVLTVRSMPANRGDPWQYEVSSTPDGSGSFPAFIGSLQIEPGSDYNAFSLCLTASYVGPSRADPMTVDAGTARKSMKEIAAAMLLAIAADIESTYRKDERVKLTTMIDDPA